MRLVAVICSLALFAAVATGATSGDLVLRPGAKGTLASTDLFRLQVSLNGKAQPDEWTSPATGAYSTVIGGTKYWFDRGDALIYRQPDLGGARALYHGEHDYLRVRSSGDLDFRTGAALVLAYLYRVKIHGSPDPAFTASTVSGHTELVLRGSYPHDTGPPSPMEYRIKVVDRVTLAEARDRGLLTGTVAPTSTTWQARPGAAAHTNLTPYWLGPRSGAHVAVMVEETREANASSYRTWYAAPSSACAMRGGTAGRNHWWPGLGGNTCDEWKITTLPAGALPNLGSGRAIELADGERAELLLVDRGFYVRTRHALVEISADTMSPIDRIALARSLRLVKP